MTTPTGEPTEPEPHAADDPYADVWEDEWSDADWHELNIVDRRQRNIDGWGAWLLHLGIIALVVPVILGLLVWLLIVAI